MKTIKRILFVSFGIVIGLLGPKAIMAYTNYFYPKQTSMMIISIQSKPSLQINFKNN
jgi:hypothetical protein